MKEVGPLLRKVVVKDLLKGRNELGPNLRRRGSEDGKDAVFDRRLFGVGEFSDLWLEVIRGRPSFHNAILEVYHGCIKSVMMPDCCVKCEVEVLDSLIPLSCSCSRTSRSASEKPGVSSACSKVSITCLLIPSCEAYLFEFKLGLTTHICVGV